MFVKNIRVLCQLNKYILHRAAIFFLTILISVSLLSVPSITQLFNQDLAGFISQMTASLLNVLALQASVDGSLIQSGNFVARIIAACTPLYPWVLFLAIALAYPSRLRDKAIGLALVLPALLLINQVRIVSLIYIGIHFPEHLETAHYLIWQSLMMFITVVLGLYWMNKVTRYEHA